MERQTGIPLEEAIKHSNEKFLAYAAENERRRKEAKAQLDLRLETLRSKISLEGMDFHDQEALAQTLSHENYLVQMVTLEKAAETGAISPQQMIDLFSSTLNVGTRFAIIENLPRAKFAYPEEKNGALSLLENVAIGNFADGEATSGNINQLDYLYLFRYRMDWEEDANFDMMTTAAIEALAKFGKDAEDYLIDVLKHNLEKGKAPDMREIVGPENYILHEDDGSLDGFFNDRGFVVDAEAKSAFDPMYPYNALTIQKLAEIGSRKAVDFLVESIPEKGSAFDIIYYREAEELLLSMLKAEKAAGGKIDYIETKYLKLTEKPIGQDLPDEEKMEILELAEDTYFNDVFKNNPEAAQRVIDKLKGVLFGPDGLTRQRTYTLKFRGNVVAFVRFKPVEKNPGHVYAASLNVRKELCGYSVGKYFAGATEKIESRSNVLHAVVREDDILIAKHRKSGWTIDEKKPFVRDGIKYFNMTLDRREKR